MVHGVAGLLGHLAVSKINLLKSFALINFFVLYIIVYGIILPLFIKYGRSPIQQSSHYNFSVKIKAAFRHENSRRHQLVQHVQPIGVSDPTGVYTVQTPVVHQQMTTVTSQPGVPGSNNVTVVNAAVKEIFFPAFLNIFLSGRSNNVG